MIRRVLAVVAASFLSSCALVVSFDGYEEFPPVARFAVRGTVEGLEFGTVAISLNGGAPIDVGNGPFAFPGVASGTGYVVTARDPVGHACTVEHGSGVIGSADVTDVMVRCTSTDASLASLSLSDLSLSPGFSPGVHAYTAGPLSLRFFSAAPVIVSAATKSPSARVSIAGAPAIVAKATAPVPIRVGQTAIDVTVTAADGKTRTSTTIDVSGTRTSMTYVKASNTRAFALFGSAVAVSGDTVVVGAPGESSDATGIDGDQSSTMADSAGAVYVFRRNGATWSQEAYVKASNTLPSSTFGWSVALSGDTLVVGSPGESSNAKGIGGDQSDSSAMGAGAVYVFTRTGKTWTQQAYIKASNTREYAAFGSAVALSGDTLAVGSYQESSNAKGVGGNQADTSAQSAGAVYVFARTGTTWAQEAYVKASNTRAGAGFGKSVALSVDLLAVGAPGESSDATGAGAAYVFARTGTTWAQQAYVKASNSRADTGFGDAVALSGDTLAVGAPGESSKSATSPGDTSAPGAGAAYVFTRSGSTWTQQAYLKASNARAEAAFGVAVALSGDVLAVGSHSESSFAQGLDGDQSDTTGVRAGAVYAFRRTGAAWSQDAYVKASNTRPNAFFGWSVALSPETLAIGSVGETSGSTGIGGDQASSNEDRAGAVYLY